MYSALDIRSVEEGIKGYITKKRYRHSLGVKETAALLAARYGCSVEKAEVAALLHDVARDLPLEDMQNLVKEAGPQVAVPLQVFGNPLLLHAAAGRAIAERDFRIHDEEILRSIQFHTAGGCSMGVLEKVIFVADFIEPGRTFRGVKTARRLAFRDLNGTLGYIYAHILKSLLSRRLFIFEKTLLGYNEAVRM